jgi:hypothetical protein
MDKESRINPLPGYFLAVIDKSQMSNVNFAGDDKFDLPQTGTLIKLHKTDENKPFTELDDSFTISRLMNHKVMWAKYAESDCLIYDNDLQKDVVLISLDKLRGYE